MLRIAENSRKHHFFLVLGVPTFGDGEGGSTWLGQNPKFFQKIDLRAPLSYRLKLLTREETQAQRSLKLH